MPNPSLSNPWTWTTSGRSSETTWRTSTLILGLLNTSWAYSGMCNSRTATCSYMPGTGAYSKDSPDSLSTG